MRFEDDKQRFLQKCGKFVANEASTTEKPDKYTEEMGRFESCILHYVYLIKSSKYTKKLINPAKIEFAGFIFL